MLIEGARETVTNHDLRFRRTSESNLAHPIVAAFVSSCLSYKEAPRN